ncbi:hypothetical protein LshimejAT787_0210870 [Lyophyllum shimeji]|uniref:Zn(2)-C6 fungal-type domain-containing protein n=1 Tax=Lyophyllum shimeji TaxID=47721 RepID=A0A9P3PHK2_LYOSH|nr:hypothetical protein LshimejAT787_0210870 [Lyophyllum shimeji]
MPPHKSENTLRRGTACLSCRKRKLKCDGTRPVCRQCTKMNRGHTCEYDDKQRKSRTQLLKEQLSQLERRLHELESKSKSSSSSPAPPSPPFQYDFESFGLEAFNDAPVASSSKYSLVNATSSSDTSPSPTPSGSRLANQSALFHPGDKYWLPSESSRPSSASNSVLGAPSQVDPRVSLSPRARRYLLDVFMNHRHQCWFYASMDRFLNSSLNQEPHPALINAMYLLACHFAHMPFYSEMIPAFFVQTQHEINAALDTSDRLADIVQASSLLAIYLYMNNRVVEGYRHTFSAVRLAIGLGLHQISTSNTIAKVYPRQTPLIPIAPPRDARELSDRIFAFWQVFMIDRCWSVANGLPLALPDKNTPQCRILTRWPSALGHWPDDGFQPPIQSFFDGLDTLGASEQFMPALKAKAAALYELTSRSKTFGSDPNDWAYCFAEAAVQRFSSTIPSLTFDRDYFMVQTVIYTSFVHLQRHVLFDGRALKAGNSIVQLILQLRDADWQYLDPIISVCWFTVAEMFICAIMSAKVDAFAGDVSNIVSVCTSGLDVLSHALTTYGAYCPLSGDLALKVELARG